MCCLHENVIREMNIKFINYNKDNNDYKEMGVWSQLFHLTYRCKFPMNENVNNIVQ